MLKDVGTSVIVDGTAKADFPMLKAIGASVIVYGTAKADFPMLKDVGASVRVYGTATFPMLKDVGTSVIVDGTATVVMPPREKIGKNPKPVSPIREVFAKCGYMFADNILSRIVNQKKSGKITIYKTRKIGNRDKIVYVVQKGEIFSHGETVKQATHDLRYKLADRDTTKYKGWTVDTVKPIADIIGAYRAITGACETGTKMFCEGKNIPEKMSVKAAIAKTTGAYKAKQFAAFFTEG